VVCGECVDVMGSMEAESFDLVLTDPPYGLEFMGKEWDKLSSDPDIGKARKTGFEKLSGQPDQRKGNEGGTWFGSRDGTAPNYYRTTNAKCRKCGKWRVSGGHDGKGNTLGCKCEVPDFPNVKADAARRMQHWHENWARAALRVLKPGGSLVAFGGTRTHHRLMCAIEDAGFEIRDVLMWLYGSGFPKSMAVDKAIQAQQTRGSCSMSDQRKAVMGDDYKPSVTVGHTRNGSEPAMNCLRADPPSITVDLTPLARFWAGYGTALKPSYEIICWAMKPLDGTFAQNAERHGVAGLNVDGGRVGYASPTEAAELDRRCGPHSRHDPKSAHGGGSMLGLGGQTAIHPQGRFPANLILDEAAGAMLDEQSGELGKSFFAGGPPRMNTILGRDNRPRVPGPSGNLGFGDSGGASRFFYCAKASRSEREAGLEGMEAKQTDESRDPDAPGGNNPRNRGAKEVANHHPTVKPLALMRYLLTLFDTPTGGKVLDPFGGSGSTAVACVELGRDCTIIEREPEYAEIARKRIDAALRQTRLAL